MQVSLIQIAVFAATILFSTVLCRFVMYLACKNNWYDVEDPRKMHKGNIPRLGGISVILTFVIFCIIEVFVFKTVFFKESLLLILGTLLIFVSCIADDFVTMRARCKLIFQVLAALCVAFSPFTFKNLFGLQLPCWLDHTAVFLWTLLIVNAYNLIDGVDWLCSGLSVFTLIFYAAVHYVSGSSNFIFIMILCCSVIGFMVWNKPKAKIFLGDCGSETLGYLIAVIPLLPTKIQNFEYYRALIVLIISAIPTIDVLAAIIRRVRDKKGVFNPDRAHLHHKLFNIGFSVKSILTLLLTLQIGVCLIVFNFVCLSNEHCLFILLTAYIAEYCFFITIHYINRAVNSKMKGILQNQDKTE